MKLLNLLHRSLLQSGSIPAGSRVLIAVSGGADSVALLSLLHQISATMELYLEAAHLDHALRETSCADAIFVEQLCRELEIPLTVERQDVAAVARQRKGNLEEVAREVRREFLVRTAQARSCQLIALGHHADDQAETFLMRLLRGSGTTGLAGMRVVDDTIVRPLLSFSRDELLGYLKEERLTWREDESNLDQTFTRNRIRHHLLPLLESYNPNVSSRIASLCEQMRKDDDYWSGLVAEELFRCGQWQEREYVLNRLLFLELAPALTGRMVRAALKEVRGDLRGITTTHVTEVVKLACGSSPQKELNLPGAWVARRYEKLLFRKQKPEDFEFCEMLLAAPGSYSLPDGLRLHVSLETKALGESVDVAEFDAAALSFPLRLRRCQSGDRIRPSGMHGTKKLQDLFVDLKLTREERQSALLLAKDDHVLWVIGLRRSEGWRHREGESVLRFVLQRQKKP